MANVRISCVEQRPDGQFDVSAVLPNGALVQTVTPAIHNREELARFVIASEHRRTLPHLTGFVDVPDADYEKLLAQGVERTRAAQEAHQAASENAEAESAESAESADDTEAESAEGAEGDQKASARRSRR